MNFPIVMAGLDPAIHGRRASARRKRQKLVDARNKSGHDVLGGLVVCGLLAASPALAQEPVQIRFGSAPVPTSPLQTRGVGPFTQQLEADAQGTLKIVYYPGAVLGPPGLTYDNTMRGVYDMSFGMFGVVSSQFPRTHVT